MLAPVMAESEFADFPDCCRKLLIYLDKYQKTTAQMNCERGHAVSIRIAREMPERLRPPRQ
jgi:hypothetical protein